MKLEDFQIELKQLPGAMPVWHGRVDAQQWRVACQQVRDKGGQLVALWGADNDDRGLFRAGNRFSTGPALALGPWTLSRRTSRG